MRRDIRCLFLQHPKYVALISVLISPVPHIWGVTNGSLLRSAPNSCRSPASLISPAPHICGALRTPILTRIVWKISNIVTKSGGRGILLISFTLSVSLAVRQHTKTVQVCIIVRAKLLCGREYVNHRTNLNEYESRSKFRWCK